MELVESLKNGKELILQAMYSLYLQFALQSMYRKLGYQRSGKATPIPKTSIDE